MDFEVYQKNDVMRINVLAPSIDAACAIQFKDQFREICAKAPPRVLLDLQKVDFLDSSGLGAVVASMKFLGEDRRLEIAGLTPKVSKVFRLTRMDTVFTIHPSADRAMHSRTDEA